MSRLFNLRTADIDSGMFTANLDLDQDLSSIDRFMFRINSMPCVIYRNHEFSFC